MPNLTLARARKAKNDEFYTQYKDIEAELSHYIDKFRNQVVYCNCDSEVSSFYQYFKTNFKQLGLKQLIATYYAPFSKPSILTYDGDKMQRRALKADGDFRSPECIEIMERADIVCTNPPFSLFRPYIKQLVAFNKKFLVMGSLSIVATYDLAPYIKGNELWLGNRSGAMIFNNEFGQPQKFGNIAWFTNMDYEARHRPLILSHKYNAENYSKYDSYNAINIDKVSQIPCDYYDEMGVPITFLLKWCPAQFEIVDMIGRYSHLSGATEETRGKYMASVKGENRFSRIIIKRVLES